MRGLQVFGASVVRLLVVLGALALLGVWPACARAAVPAAGWTISSFAAPSAFSVGDDAQCASNFELCDSYTVTARNAGSVATNGETVTLTVALPMGLVVERVAFSSERPGYEREVLETDCTSMPLQCRYTGAVAPDQTLRMIVYVSVQAGASSPLASIARVLGGGEPEASTSAQALLGPATPPFGIASFAVGIVGLDGLADTHAGGHPYELTATIALNNVFRNGPESFDDTSVQDVKDLVIEPPLGFLASTVATPTCTFAQLDSTAESGGCPSASAVGRIRTEPEGGSSLNGQIYNMTPEHGFPAELGYVDLLKDPHVLYVSVVPTPAGYVLRVTANDIPQVHLTALTVTLFGDPEAMDASPDTPVSMLTNPSVCSGQPLATNVYMDSWQKPGSYNADGTPNFDDPAWVSASSRTPALTGCNELVFSPQLSAQPTTHVADSPTGLELELGSPTGEGAEASATPPLQRAVVMLPEGMTLDPSAGYGLQACSIAQIGWLGPDGRGGEPLPDRGLTNFSPEEPGCPDESKIGSLELTTPLFSSVLTGALYLASQDENPFGSVLAAYAVVDDQATGVVLKIPAELQADPHTGRLTVVLVESPQLPFRDLKLRFFSGPRALFATPDSCGAYTTTSVLTPFSAPASGPDATSTDSFQIDGGCASGFAPIFTAGATNLQAGAFAPFEVSFSREGTDEELAGWTVSLPPGLLADIGTVPPCPDAAANAGSCPEASQVGTVLAGAGPGPNPLFASGKAYLTGPYNGGPYGLSIVVPVVAGPLNLGTVVVRQSLRIDPTDGHITDVSDPFPTILDVAGANGQIDGVPIRLRRVDVIFDRPDFTFNPTNCAKLPLVGSIASTDGASAALSSPFQVTDCAGLRFTPKLTALTRANGELTGHGASLHIEIASPAGQTNLRSLKLDLPQRLPARLETIQRACKEDVFERDPAACPKASVIGSAIARTPILATTMAGPAYLVAKAGASVLHARSRSAHSAEAAFPDIVLVLQAQGVRIDLTGGLYVSERNVTSATFRSLPDVPIRRLDLILPEGQRSILAANASLCARPLRMTTAITAQDGARVNPTVTVAVEGCKKTKRPKHRRRPARR